MVDLEVYKDTSKSTIVYIEKPPSLYPAVYKDTSKFTIVYREKPLLTVPVIIYRPRIAVSLCLPLSVLGLYIITGTVKRGYSIKTMVDLERQLSWVCI
jgi:hypothetical protein